MTIGKRKGTAPARSEAARLVETADLFARVTAQVGAAADLHGALVALARGAMELLDGDVGVVRLFALDRPAAELRVRLNRGEEPVTTDFSRELAAGSMGQRLWAGELRRMGWAVD